MSSLSFPLVSVVVPVFNVETYLDECINSIRDQSYRNLEILLVDDCSTDASLGVLQPHLEDERARLIQHNHNRGLSAARNTGIEAAKGEFICFIDSDDIADKRLVETCVGLMLSDKLQALLFSFTSFKDGDAIPINTELPRTDLTSSPLEDEEYFKYPHFAWLKFLRTDLFNDTSLRFPENQYYEDWPFHWNLGFSANNIRYVKEPLIYYRLRQDSITGTDGQRLFHILSANLLVAQVVESNDASKATKTVLAEKMLSGAWFVIRNINSRFLGETVAQTSQYLKQIRPSHFSVPARIKYRVICILLGLPIPISIFGIKALRISIDVLSKLRMLVPYNR